MCISQLLKTQPWIECSFKFVFLRILHSLQSHISLIWGSYEAHMRLIWGSYVTC
jgi:hypothetical protein